MTKIVKILFLLILTSNILFAKEDFLNRNLICLYNSLQKEDSFYNNIHQRLEVILNYYGYYCDYYDANKLPKDTSKYSGIVYWASSNELNNPIEFYNWLIKNKKNKKIFLLGDLPVASNKKENFTDQVNKILKQKLLDKNKYEKNKKQITAMAEATINAAMLDSLIKDLMTKYNITTYIK